MSQTWPNNTIQWESGQKNYEDRKIFVLSGHISSTVKIPLGIEIQVEKNYNLIQIKIINSLRATTKNSAFYPVLQSGMTFSEEIFLSSKFNYFYSIGEKIKDCLKEISGINIDIDYLTSFLKYAIKELLRECAIDKLDFISNKKYALCRL